MKDLAERYEAEAIAVDRDQVMKQWEWYQTSLRLPAFMFDRLDRLAEYTHQSRQRLVAHMLDEATMDLAHELATRTGYPDKELEAHFLGDLDIDPSDLQQSASE